MKRYNADDPLISIHIPKCAGTSFISVLKHWYGDKLHLHYFDEVENRMPVKYMLAGNKGHGVCIHGHFNKTRGFGVQDYYPEVKQFITFMRDPFEMCLSNYFYVQERHAAQLSYRDAKPYALEELDKYVRNARSYMLFHMPYEMTLSNYKDVIDNYFIYIGIVEDYKNSIERLAAILGFDSPPLEHLNQSNNHISNHLKLRDAFVARHALEYAIYDYAKKLFK